MKKIVLLGDSIRLLGYGKLVEQMLDKEYQVWQPDVNCRFSTHTLRMLYEYKNDLKDADVIHWNNGLWDTTLCLEDGPFTPLHIYIETMKRIAETLLKITNKVIFATTTPVSDKRVDNNNELINMYNEAIVPILKNMGVYINDLNALVCEKVGDYISEDLIHLSDKGAYLCAQKVVDIIRIVDKA